MCMYVDSACFIANAFAVTERKSFSLPEMRVMTSEVQDALQDENVVVDWTRQSVLSAFEYHSSMFVKYQDEVCRAEDADKYFNPDFMKDEFNCGLPESVIARMQKAIRSHIEGNSTDALAGR